jgi:hypothetical protein
VKGRFNPNFSLILARWMGTTKKDICLSDALFVFEFGERAFTFHFSPFTSGSPGVNFTCTHAG